MNPPHFTGERSSHWKGGLSLSPTGYMLKRVEKKYIYEHRYVMEKFLGRKLESKEHVHHINRNKTDNRIENLELIPNAKEHAKHHAKDAITPESRKKKSDSLKIAWARGDFSHRVNGWIKRKVNLSLNDAQSKILRLRVRIVAP